MNHIIIYKHQGSIKRVSKYKDRVLSKEEGEAIVKYLNHVKETVNTDPLNVKEVKGEPVRRVNIDYEFMCVPETEEKSILEQRRGGTF